MSRVTIKDVYWELDSDASNKSWDSAKEIEIVPRKIVEMIIEMCKENEERLRPRYITSFEDSQDIAYTNIREYAESLLKQFEEDDE